MRIERRRLLKLLGASALLSCAPALAYTLEEIRQKGRVRIAVYNDFPPFSLAGKGVDVDLAGALAQKLGVRLELMWLTADENLEDDLRNAVWKGHYLGGGTADVMLHVPVDEDFAARNDKVAIFGPYYRETIELARDTRRIAQLPNLQVFQQEKIGVELETVSDAYLLSAFGGSLRNNVVHYKSAVEAVAGMRRGEVAAVMAPRSDLQAGLGADTDGFVIAPVATPGLAITGWKVGMAVKADNAGLRDALSGALADLLADGSVGRIFAAHGITHRAP